MLCTVLSPAVWHDRPRASPCARLPLGRRPKHNNNTVRARVWRIGANLFWASLALLWRTHRQKQHPSYPLGATQRSVATAWEGRIHGTQTGMLRGVPRSARCVQRFDDSRNSAIHITYRVSLRSSSMGEPRDPLSKVVFVFVGRYDPTTKRPFLLKKCLFRSAKKIGRASAQGFGSDVQ
jgi:hypothetical protein